MEVTGIQAGRSQASSFLPVGGALAPLLFNFNPNQALGGPAVKFFHLGLWRACVWLQTGGAFPISAR